METSKYYRNGELVEIIDLFEDKNGRLVAVVEYPYEDMYGYVDECYFDCLEQKTVKF